MKNELPSFLKSGARHRNEVETSIGAEGSGQGNPHEGLTYQSV